MRAAVQALPGIVKIDYDPGGDIFVLEYQEGRVKLEDVFTAVVQAGRIAGREYWPKLVS